MNSHFLVLTHLFFLFPNNFYSQFLKILIHNQNNDQKVALK
jgi:hypothetical protein